MLENCDIDIKNLLKKTISFQKRTYVGNSLLRSKMTNGMYGDIEIENKKDYMQESTIKDSCFGKKNCVIF